MLCAEMLAAKIKSCALPFSGVFAVYGRDGVKTLLVGGRSGGDSLQAQGRVEAFGALGVCDSVAHSEDL